MDPTVLAAWIAAGVSALTLAGTLAAQYVGYRATSKDAEKTAEEQRKQLDLTLAEQRTQLDRTLEQQRDHLDRTLAEQNQQLDRTLSEQRTRTLNERFATAAGQLGDDKPAAVRLAGVYAMAGLADDWEANRQTCVDAPATRSATAQRTRRKAAPHHDLNSMSTVWNPYPSKRRVRTDRTAASAELSSAGSCSARS
jgi:hypothetical protein